MRHNSQVKGTTGMAESSSDVPDVMRERGARICRDYLAGSWLSVLPDDFHIERIK